MTSHQGQNEKSRRGAQGPPVHQIWCNSDHYFRSYGILKKMAHAIFFRSAAILKLESASWTKLVFELVRALSERKPTCEFWSNSGFSERENVSISVLFRFSKPCHMTRCTIHSLCKGYATEVRILNLKLATP